MESQAFALLKSTLDEIRTDVRGVRSELHDNNEALLRNTITLEEHVRRTDILQDTVNKLLDLISKFEARMAHVDKHVYKVEGILSVFRPTPAKVGILVSAVTATLTFFTSFREFAIKVLSVFFR